MDTLGTSVSNYFSTFLIYIITEKQMERIECDIDRNAEARMVIERVRSGLALDLYMVITRFTEVIISRNI